MSLFKNKVFIMILLAAVSFSLLSAKPAQAGGVVSILTGGLSNVINAVSQAIGISIVSVLLSPLDPGMAVLCYSGVICDLPSGGTGVTIVPVSGVTGVCSWQIPVTFYNPRPDYYYRYYTYTTCSGRDEWGQPYDCIENNVDALAGSSHRYTDTGCVSAVSNYWTYSQSVRVGSQCYATTAKPYYTETTCSGRDQWGQPSDCTTASLSNFQPMLDYSTESSRQVSIYRLTLPSDSSQSALDNWFYYIKTQVGNGWLRVDYMSCDGVDAATCGENAYNTASDFGALRTVVYSELCSGNVCSFTDATAPDNMYVAYVAKVLGSYAYPYTYGGDEWGQGGTLGVISGSNKFFNNNNSSDVIFPYTTIGNAIAGPYKTGTADCSPVCGDGVCNGTETYSSCPADCPRPANLAPSAINLAVIQPDYQSAGPAATFSWTFTDPDAGDTQSAYQIQVATNAGFSGPGTVVDSGQVSSASQAYATGSGKLSYNQKYYWRLKVWDSQGADSGWITPPASSFTTPLHQYPSVNDIYWAPANPSVGEEGVFGAIVKCYQTGGAEVACPLANFHWTFSGGTPASVDGQAAPQVTFSDNGLYQITLNITDNDGYPAQRTEALSIRLPLPSWKEVAPQ